MGGGVGYKGALAGNAAAGSEEPKGGMSCSCVVLVKAGASSVSFFLREFHMTCRGIQGLCPYHQGT